MRIRKNEIEISGIISVLLLFVCTLLVISCQKDEFPGKATIGSEGGTLFSIDGMVKLSIPPGALSAPTEIRIFKRTGQNFFLGKVIEEGFSIEPSGISIARPVEVEISIDHVINDILHFENLGILNTGTVNGNILTRDGKYNIEDRFINAKGVELDLDAGTLKFSLDHLSQFQIVEFQGSCAVFNFYWDIPVIKWYLDPAIPSSSYLNESNVVDALDLWANETSSFTVEKTQDEKNANIIFREVGNREGLKPYEAGYHIHAEPAGLTSLGSGYYPTSENWVLAFDETVQLSVVFASDLIQSADENTNLSIARKTLTHEIGHALGIGHTITSALPTPVMHETVDTSGLWDGELHEMDINALHRYYAMNHSGDGFMSIDTLFDDLEYPLALFLDSEKLYYTEMAAYQQYEGTYDVLNVYDLQTSQSTRLTKGLFGMDALVVIDDKIYLGTWKNSIPGEKGVITVYDQSENEETVYRYIDIAIEDMCLDQSGNFYVLGSSDLSYAASLYTFAAPEYRPAVLLRGLGRTTSIAPHGNDIYYSDHKSIWKVNDNSAEEFFRINGVSDMVFSDSYVYFSDNSKDKLCRMNLESKVIEVLFDNMPAKMVFDNKSNSLFIGTYTLNSELYDGSILRITNIE